MLHERQAQTTPPPSAGYCAESNKASILSITGVFTSIAIVVVVARIVVRALMIKSVGRDDYAMSFALLMAIVTMVCFVYETKYGIGKHTTCVSPPDYSTYIHWQYYHSMVVMVGVVVVKISIALFLLRLIPPGKWWKRFLWAVIIFLVCFCLTCLGTLIWQCNPIPATWDFRLRSQPGTRCWSPRVFTDIGLFNSIINCITDGLLAFVPVPIIVQLQVNIRTKYSLAFVLSLGYFACAAGIVKAIKQHDFFEQKDPLWTNGFNVWNHIELTVGIIAASLPALRPLFAKILESSKFALSGSWHGSKRRTANASSGLHGPRSDDIDFLVGKEFQMDTMGGSLPSRNVTVVESPASPEQLKRAQSHDRSYTVAITGGCEKANRTSNGSGISAQELVPARNQSLEALTRPDAIYKKTEVTSLTYSRSN